MKTKNGFTLIELLAVIVILGVIMVIAVPSVTHLITKSKRDAAVASGQGYVDAIDKESAVTSMEQGELASEGIYDVSYFTSKVTLNGSKPTAGTVTIDEEGSVVSANLCINNILVNYANKTASTSGTKCTTTMKTYVSGTVVYYNPVSGNICTFADYTANTGASNTGTKTGCMKWYTFNDEGTSASTINMILDHNTTAMLAWNSTGSNVNGPTNVITQLKADTSTWAGVPTRNDKYNVSNGTATYIINYSAYKARLIKAQEIATITGNTNFVEETLPYISWFYLDSNNQIQTATTTGASNYDWLFDYTNGCTSYGCNIADASNYGYWTSTAVSGNATDSWVVRRNGHMSFFSVININNYGVRPVITISKLIIE